jgi:hypothetical protein
MWRSFIRRITHIQSFDEALWRESLRAMHAAALETPLPYARLGSW